MVKKKRQSDVHDNGSSTDSTEEKFVNPSAEHGMKCLHVDKSVYSSKLRKQLKTAGLVMECAKCKTGAASPAAEAKESGYEDLGFEYDNTLWLCLKCGTQLCGRSRNQHALQHFKTPRSDSHALAMNTRSYEIWCYECDNEVDVKLHKNLAECIDVVKKLASKTPPQTLLSPSANGGDASSILQFPSTAPPSSNSNVENKIAYTWEDLRLPGHGNDDAKTTSALSSNKAIPLPPPPPPLIPGMAKRINDPVLLPTSAANSFTTSANFSGAFPNILGSNAANGAESANTADIEILPRVRGLTNLGNTCFFNAVMQCLAQTPYLLEVLKESSEPGEEFILPGGTFKFKDEEDVLLPKIEGTLSSWGSLTAALANALEELQSGGGVFTPSKLFDKLCTKCPQFRGGDQHDSHELLRHLLESVRSEDLRRYQMVILQSLGYKNQDINSVSEEMRQKCKVYGNQAADRILRPEQVFRGFLVSTLTCQDCYNVSSRHEYFLDMSLPVSVEKPQPPQRRKTSPDNEPANSFFLHPAPTAGPTKAQQKKEKEKERKAKRVAKHQNNKLAQKILFDDITSSADVGSTDAKIDSDDVETVAAPKMIGCATRDEAEASVCSSSSSSSVEQSDADVEDNLIDDNIDKTPRAIAQSVEGAQNSLCDPNGNNQLLSTVTQTPEKRDDSPENMDKDSLDEDENDSGIATSPANAGNCSGSSYLPSSETNGGSDANSLTINNSVLAVGLSEKGVNLMRQRSLQETQQQHRAHTQTSNSIGNGEINEHIELSAAQMEKLQLNEQKMARKKAKRVRTQSHSDWSTTIAPRYRCEDGECSVQSCLNNFTAVELMTGNNKVGCENCTKRINGDDPKAKTVNTNATKQFLISSPPAVLILHLKRFQLGPRMMFRKLTRAVSFPMVLDIAPFCGSKVKNLPNIDRKQKKLIYALYGIVEHAGNMYGGHYTAYVKVRPKLANDDIRWKFLPQGSKAELDQDDEQRKKLEELLAKEKARDMRMKAANDSDDFSNSSVSSSCSSDIDETLQAAHADDSAGAVGGDEEARNVQVPLGKWYYVSDSRVKEVGEDEVLKAQAYLLFYERIY